jgi:hypothetical protein
VVADLVHLLAEPLDNANLFSPPASQVENRGNMRDNGVLVEGQGLGVPNEERDRLNEWLRSAPDFGVMSLSQDARLGLFVVGRLAARHGSNVTLAEPAYGGTRAIVLIRQPLIADPDDESDDHDTGNRAGAAIHTPPQRRTSTMDSLTFVLNATESATEEGKKNGDKCSLSEPTVPETTVTWPSEERANDDHVATRHASPVTPVDGLSTLPQRRRQASRAPRVVADAGPPAELADRSAELARDTMAAFQRGTRRAREAE